MKTSKNLRNAISNYWNIKTCGFNPKLVYNHHLGTFMAVYIYMPNIPGIELIAYSL